MDLQNVNIKLLLGSYVYCKALEFELNHPIDSLKDRVAYFVSCKVYEVVIFILLNVIARQYLVYKLKHET